MFELKRLPSGTIPAEGVVRERHDKLREHLREVTEDTRREQEILLWYSKRKQQGLD
jgi:hypothetical protein